MKYYNSDIVFQEIPDETTLAINISGCPNRCPGCHSKWLWEDVGRQLCTAAGVPDATDGWDFSGLEEIVGKYARNISCVCFMGGDQSPETVDRMALRVKELWPHLKTGWYSGRPAVPDISDATDIHSVPDAHAVPDIPGATDIHSVPDAYAAPDIPAGTGIGGDSIKKTGISSDKETDSAPDREKLLYEALQQSLPSIDIDDFDFIKLGPYIASLGGLRSETTNQRIYRIEDGRARVIHIHDPHKFQLS